MLLNQDLMYCMSFSINLLHNHWIYMYMPLCIKWVLPWFNTIRTNSECSKVGSLAIHVYTKAWWVAGLASNGTASIEHIKDQVVVVWTSIHCIYKEIHHTTNMIKFKSACTLLGLIMHTLLFVNQQPQYSQVTPYTEILWSLLKASNSGEGTILHASSYHHSFNHRS